MDSWRQALIDAASSDACIQAVGGFPSYLRAALWDGSIHRRTDACGALDSITMTVQGRRDFLSREMYFDLMRCT